MILTNQNCRHKEIKSILNSGNSCYHLVNNHFCFPSCNLQMKRLKIYGIILCVVLYGCEAWSLKVTERIHTEVFRIGYWGRYQSKMAELKSHRSKLHNKKLHNTRSQSITVWVIKCRIRWAEYMAHMWGREVYTRLWRGNLKARGHWEDTGTDGRITLKCILKKWDGKVWTGLIWLRIGIRRGLIRTREWTFQQNEGNFMTSWKTSMLASKNDSAP